MNQLSALIKLANDDELTGARLTPILVISINETCAKLQFISTVSLGDSSGSGC